MPPLPTLLARLPKPRWITTAVRLHKEALAALSDYGTTQHWQIQHAPSGGHLQTPAQNGRRLRLTLTVDWAGNPHLSDELPRWGRPGRNLLEGNSAHDTIQRRKAAHAITDPACKLAALIATHLPIVGDQPHPTALHLCTHHDPHYKFGTWRFATSLLRPPTEIDDSPTTATTQMRWRLALLAQVMRTAPSTRHHLVHPHTSHDWVCERPFDAALLAAALLDLNAEQAHSLLGKGAPSIWTQASPDAVGAAHAAFLAQAS